MLQWQPICVQSPLFFSLSIVTDKKQHVFLQQCLTHYTALWKFSSHVCGEMNMLHSFYTGAQSVWSKLWIHYDVVHLPSLKTLHINMEHWTGFTDLFYITYTFFLFVCFFPSILTIVQKVCIPIRPVRKSCIPSQLSTHIWIGLQILQENWSVGRVKYAPGFLRDVHQRFCLGFVVNSKDGTTKQYQVSNDLFSL